VVVHKVTLATLRERLPAGTTLIETVSPGEDSVEVPTYQQIFKNEGKSKFKNVESFIPS
jgi:hypothetical protein